MEQRFENYVRALALLREVFARGLDQLSDLEKEGGIQRFEFTYELGWKVMRDYLQSQGVEVDPVTPREVIKQAFAVNLIQDGQIWIVMMLERNRLAHTYDIRVFEAALNKVEQHYLDAFEQLYDYLVAAGGAA